MPVVLTWQDIAVRLGLATVAGALVGFNRGEHGRPAGLRTTLLVCLAACIAMIQANIILSTTGRRTDSFVMMDTMRLPLGILSGMGFLGAGAILRKGNMVLGVTTAATLWFVTVMGLCFGGGQLALGLIALVLALMILWGLKLVEMRLHQELRATLTVRADASGPSQEQMRQTVLAASYRILTWSVAFSDMGRRWTVRCYLEWRGDTSKTELP
ncbi:MAG TPA: MgtC/SapB family protein, partial [Tepidisphaeraceae bacterium]|nr:MgtC/SapB family protein [Tepidisphaeraceae bacterium]